MAMTPNIPTLIYPLGGEVIFTPEIVIQWVPAGTLDADGETVSYELYYTDYFDAKKEPDWKQIAVVPASVNQFIWQPRGVRSLSVRIAIRTVDGYGNRSLYSISGSNFAVQFSRIAVPSIISPAPSGQYDKFIWIQPDDNAILNTVSQRTYYQFYYSSQSAGIQSTLIAQDIPIGSDPIFWNTVLLPSATDYILEAYLENDDGGISDKLLIPFEIQHAGYFLLDTKPPVSAITVNNNDSFTDDRSVSVQIASFDETTAVQSMQLLEGTTSGEPDQIGSVRVFELSSGDGIKAIELLLQDFGGNRNNEVLQRLFQVLVEFTGTEIADIAVDNVSGVLWAVTSGAGYYLYQVTEFPSRKTTFIDEPTAVAVLASQPYVATRTDSNTSTLWKYSDTQEVINVFTAVDTAINTMTVYNETLFLGMENGSIYSYSGTAVTLVQQMSKPVAELTQDTDSLYASLKNDLNIYAYNGSSFNPIGSYASIEFRP